MAESYDPLYTSTRVSGLGCTALKKREGSPVKPELLYPSSSHWPDPVFAHATEKKPKSHFTLVHRFCPITTTSAFFRRAAVRSRLERSVFRPGVQLIARHYLPGEQFLTFKRGYTTMFSLKSPTPSRFWRTDKESNPVLEMAWEISDKVQAHFKARITGECQ